jgi:hypothetical protein
MCSSWFLLQMTMSSTQAKAAWQSGMALSTCRWKDSPAFLRPKGIRLYSNKPKGVVMAVFFTSAGFTGIWWYPFLKSILEKTVQPATLAHLAL